MLNRIILMGRLVRDPELRPDAERHRGDVLHASPWTGISRSQNRREEQADFFDVVAWRAHRRVCLPSTSPRAGWPWWRAGSRPGSGPTARAASAVSAEVVADNVYFGDSKSGRPGRRFLRPRLRTAGSCLRRRPRLRRPLRRLCPRSLVRLRFRGDRRGGRRAALLIHFTLRGALLIFE